MNPSSEANVGVVIVNFNSANHTLACVRSLESEPVASVTVWDNGSSDEDLALLREATVSTAFDLVEGGRNTGFGAGVNSAVAYARSRSDLHYVWILNPDVNVCSGALPALLEAAATQSAGIVSPKILKPLGDSSSGARVWYAGGTVIIRAGRTVHWRIGEQDRPAESGFHSVTFVSGAAPLVSLSAWDSVNGFDESFFLYCEDADLSLRAARAGIPLGVVVDAVVEHLEGGSSGSGGPTATYYYYVQRNRLVLYRRYVAVFRLLVLDGLPETIRLLVFSFTRSPGRRWTTLAASLAGVRDGILGRSGPRRPNPKADRRKQAEEA